MRAALLYSNYLDPCGQHATIGGIQTYLTRLASVCRSCGLEPTLFQWATKSFIRTTGQMTVVGVPLLNLHDRLRPAALTRVVMRQLDHRKDIIVFGSDNQAVDCGAFRTVSIQHGLGIDLPVSQLSKRAVFQSTCSARAYHAYLRQRQVRFIRRAHNMVFVDYNALNWYRTYHTGNERHNQWVIPNCADTPAPESLAARKWDTRLRILYARRFNETRGTRIMAQAVCELLKTSQDVFVTFAGTGPDAGFLKNLYTHEPRVGFVEYQWTESQQVHLQHHVAVVPSLGSEGTSLSVAEAMASGCAVIASNVGGITNMITDGYSGLLVDPTAVQLHSALSRVTSDRVLAQTIGRNASAVASASFSVPRWEDAWRSVLKQVGGQ